MIRYIRKMDTKFITKAQLPEKLKYLCVSKSGCSLVGPNFDTFNGDKRKLAEDITHSLVLGLPFSMTYITEIEF
jgi:hypothetical protein